MIGWIGKDLEGSSHGLIEVLFWNQPIGTNENHRNPQSWWLLSWLIQNEYPLNTSPDCYIYTGWFPNFLDHHPLGSINSSLVPPALPYKKNFSEKWFVQFSMIITIKQDTTVRIYFTVSKFLIWWMGLITWHQFPSVWSKVISIINERTTRLEGPTSSAPQRAVQPTLRTTGLYHPPQWLSLNQFSGKGLMQAMKCMISYFNFPSIHQTVELPPNFHLFLPLLFHPYTLLISKLLDIYAQQTEAPLFICNKVAFYVSIGIYNS
jgi:hypothetical protein